MIQVDRTMRTARWRAAMILVLILMCSAACTLGPDDLPSPKVGIGSSYQLKFEFASALNLPSGANVTMDGLRVGEVENIRVRPESVLVTARIKHDTVIPQNALAIVRQDTVLGDTYIALQRDPTQPAQTTLRDGDTIPLRQTASPPQLEDTLAVLSNFVTGGNIQKIEDSIRTVNNVMPNLKDLRGLANIVAVDTRDLSGAADRLDATISGLEETADAINSRATQINSILSPEGVAFYDHLSKQIIRHIGTLLPSIGSIFAGGIWMVPMLEAIDRALGATGLSVIPDEMMVANFVRDRLIPFVQHPSVQVTVSTPGGRRLPDVENLLRMLGVTR